MRNFVLLKKFAVISIICVCFEYSFGSVLSLEKFVTESLKSHPKVKYQDYQLSSTLVANLANESIYDRNILLQYYIEKGQNFFGTYDKDSLNHLFDLTATQSIPKYGTDISVVASHYASVNQPTIGSFVIPDTYSYGLTLQITQPLLQNAMGKIDQYPIIMKQYQDKLALLTYQQQVQEFIVYITDVYIGWAYLVKDIVVLEDQLSKAKQQFDILKRQFDASAIEELDVVLAKQAVLNKQSSLIAKRNQLNSIEKTIWMFYTGQSGEQTITFKPAEVQLTRLKTSDDYKAFINTESTTFQICELNKQMQQELIALETETLKPELNLIVLKTLTSTEESNNEAFSNIGDNAPYNIGIEFSKSLENTTAKSNKQQAEQELLKLEANNKDILLTIDDAVMTYVNQLSTVKVQKEILLESKGLSETLIKLETIKFRQGRSSTLQFVINAQNQLLLTEVQINELNKTRDMIMNQLAALSDTYIRDYQLNQEK